VTRHHHDEAPKSNLGGDRVTKPGLLARIFGGLTRQDVGLLIALISGLAGAGGVAVVRHDQTEAAAADSTLNDVVNDQLAYLFFVTDSMKAAVAPHERRQDRRILVVEQKVFKGKAPPTVAVPRPRIPVRPLPAKKGRPWWDVFHGRNG
jgi:hypothetical protein